MAENLQESTSYESCTHQGNKTTKTHKKNPTMNTCFVFCCFSLPSQVSRLCQLFNVKKERVFCITKKVNHIKKDSKFTFIFYIHRQKNVSIIFQRLKNSQEARCALMQKYLLGKVQSSITALNVSELNPKFYLSYPNLLQCKQMKS